MCGKVGNEWQYIKRPIYVLEVIKGDQILKKIKSIEGGCTSKYFVHIMCSIKTMLSVNILKIASKKYVNVQKNTWKKYTLRLKIANARADQGDYRSLGEL